MADVHFIDTRASAGRPNLVRLRRLLKKAGIRGVVERDDLVAIKLSFGELGNVGFIQPPFVRTVVEEVLRLGGRPVLMDSNTLYAGSRSNAYDSLVTALKNGFSYATVGAPILILDGLVGRDFREVPVPGFIYDRVKIGTGLLDADALISLAHFKGHMLAGFGGQIKNLSMGGAPRSGKQMMHSDVKPQVNEDSCTACGRCAKWCPAQAITVQEHAAIDAERCIGCGECTVTCTRRAIEVSWESEAGLVQKKMAEFALGALTGKAGKFLGVSFMMRITPDCDCANWSDAPITPDVGILAGLDAVALDQAAHDLVNRQEGIVASALGKRGVSAPDKFAHIHRLDPTVQLAHGQEIGLGTREYRIA